MLPSLSHLPLGPVEIHESVPSTNDLAAQRLAEGAPDLTLIIADEQTAGRGRGGRTWYTPPGSALAFSLILHPLPEEPAWVYSPLGALAVHAALADLGLQAAIKWPNDVLLQGKKVCGVLAEVHWQGERPSGVILGVGVNVLKRSVPKGPLPFPATSVETALKRRPERGGLLASILDHLLRWRARTRSPDFLAAWEDRLAYLGEEVVIQGERGTLTGLAPDGSLRLLTASGLRTYPAGDLSLRPANFP